MRVSIQNIFRLLYYQGMLTRTHTVQMYGEVCTYVSMKVKIRISLTQAFAFR